MANDVTIKKDTIDMVATKVREFHKNGELSFPANYNPENALKQAWLILQGVQDRNSKPALEVCTKDSIANSILDMVVQGLSPVKKQGYFIVYGNKLQFQRSYFGDMAVTKRLNGVKDIYAQVIYKGDEFEFVIERGSKKVVKHTQKLENIDSDNIIGAYCVVVTGNGEVADIMNIAQIRKSWTKSKMDSKSATSTHSQFTEEMAKRTVIRRACKNFINTSDDSDLIIETYNRTEEKTIDEAVEREITTNACTEIIDIETGEITPMQVESVETIDITPDF